MTLMWYALSMTQTPPDRVPQLRRRSGGGWEVYDGAAHIGWVVKLSDGLWVSYVAQAWGCEGRRVAGGMSRRIDAVRAVVLSRVVWTAR